MNITDRFPEIMVLPIPTKIELVKAILDSIAADSIPSELTDAQRAELERRLADDEANPDEGIPWEIIEEEARARRARR